MKYLAAVCVVSLTACAGNEAGSSNSFRVTAGTYGSAAAQVTNLVDSCDAPPVTADDIAAVTVAVTYVPSSGLLTAERGGQADSVAIRNDTGTRMETAVESSGGCQFRRARTLAVTLTADDALQVHYTETLSDFVSAAGANCTPPAGGSCTVAFTQALTRQ